LVATRIEPVDPGRGEIEFTGPAGKSVKRWN
jgi:hypothetical protein